MMRVGLGFDVHRLVEGRPLWLGGVNIPWERGLLGHSDADVAIHALCDALLGALALGDIGRHFPDTSDEFKGIDSKILLRRTCDMVQQKGWHLVNADITLLLQAPKIAPYVPQMRACLASVMGVAEDAVSVKATTTERLGFTGREEGVEAYASVLVCRD